MPNAVVWQTGGGYYFNGHPPGTAEVKINMGETVWRQSVEQILPQPMNGTIIKPSNPDINGLTQPR